MKCLKPTIKRLPGRNCGIVGTERITGSRGQAIRARILKRDGYLCVSCLAKGIVTPAAVIDHIVPLCNGGHEGDYNRQSLCSSCHNVKSAEEQKTR